MSKLLVTKNNLLQFMNKNDTEFYVNKSMILSPYAKDILRDRNITIKYGDRKEVNKSNDSKNEEVDIISIIKKLLIEDFQISDQEKIRYIIKKVLECINV